MYSIEYYKTKKGKKEIKEPECSSGNNRLNRIERRRYLYQRDLVDKCWNIKSLTIDLEDIKNIIYDRKLTKLFGLYSKVERANFDDSIDSITILNNNSVNLMLIYEIVNCEWMVNANEDINNLDIIKKVRQLLTIMAKDNKETEQRMKKRYEDEIHLIKYYLNTIANKSNNKKNKTRTIKLGNHFIKEKKIKNM